MTVIDYTLLAGFIGIFVGFIYGTIFGIMAFGTGTWKDGAIFYFGAQLGSPLFLMVLTFIIMGLISLIHPNLTLL